MKLHLPPQNVIDNMRTITPKGIIVHHTAGAETSSPEDINHWFVVGRAAEGYVWCGYHALIYPDGTVAQMRPFNRNGGHCPGYNNTHIGISFVGNYELKDITDEAWEAYSDLVIDLKNTYTIEDKDIINHRDANLAIGAKPTLCPGKYLYKRLKTPLEPSVQPVATNTARTLSDYTTVELLQELTRRYDKN